MVCYLATTQLISAVHTRMDIVKVLSLRIDTFETFLHNMKDSAVILVFVAVLI